ncbi:hypothetical protein [Rathayibacter tanaceti]|uniref:Uncharacterized protein n=1 Tax=Rathayibacter tanaceti TaxID=1671680 RepID=A0A166I0U6_9MICO|nr:hypothetical protein [Rathayibacter tanaceti]KZX21451.1 hypothetical protein ACH61_01412 [Rathayibacter tanaceti]
MEWTVYTVGAVLLTLVDLALSPSPAARLVFVATVVLGTLALLGRVGTWTVGLLSLAGTAVVTGLAVVSGSSGSFGLGECFVLLVLVAAASRRVNGAGGGRRRR